MILYCDTSALIKRYVEEEGTEFVDYLWDTASAIVTSIVAFAETISVFSRKFREGLLTHKEYAKTVKNFKVDYEELVLVSITKDLNTLIENLLARYPLRGFDAIHLASATIFTRPEVEDVLFACFDHNLNQAASKEGLKAVFYSE